MAVRLEQQIKRYLGSSTDAKPKPGDTGEELLPGSSFLETDTGKIYRWDGFVWQCPEADQQVLSVLQMILVELTQLRELAELATS